MAELALAARLAHELAFGLDRLADRLAVGDLRLADIGLDVELALHAVDEDVQVQLAHAGDDGLAGLFVGMHAERRVLLRQTPQRSEAHTSELQSLMRTSYAVFCLKQKNIHES